MLSECFGEERERGDLPWRTMLKWPPNDLRKVTSVHVRLEFAPPAHVADGDLWGREPVPGTGMGISNPMRRPARVYR